MKEYMSKFFSWFSGFFEEGTTGARSSSRLNSITSTFWAIIFAGVLVGFSAGLSTHITTEAGLLKVIDSFLSTIEVLTGMAITGGTIAYGVSKRTKPVKEDKPDV